jgi:hypothetical protein
LIDFLWLAVSRVSRHCRAPQLITTCRTTAQHSRGRSEQHHTDTPSQ